MKLFNNITEVQKVENLKLEMKVIIEKINSTTILASKYTFRKQFDELIQQYCFLCNKLNIEI